jgi:hypothetical protein
LLVVVKVAPIVIRFKILELKYNLSDQFRMLNSHPFLYEQEEEEVVPIIDFIELSSNLTERNYTQTQTRSDAQLESNMLNFTEEDARFPCFIDEKSLFYSSVLSKKGGGITNAKLTAHIHTIL